MNLVQTMKGRSRRAALALLLVLLCTGVLRAEQLPIIREENLAGSQVVLPDQAKGAVAVLLFGFTRESKGPTMDWGRRISNDYAHRGVELYQLPVLEEVPGVIRGMVISGIRKGVPDNQRSHFVPVLHNEAALKKLVQYKDPDDAYILVLDRAGNIVFQMHGTFSEPPYGQLRQELEKLLP